MGHVHGDSMLQSQTLEDVASAVNYHRWLTDLAVPYLGDDPLEVGSGLGDYAATWVEGTGRLTATDADGGRLEQLRQRFAADARVSVHSIELPSIAKAEHSAVVAFNVLEHIADDRAALRGLGRLVRPGGAVIVFVPAFPALMSSFDRAVGHQRRYTTDTLLQALAGAGLRTERLHYVNAPGLAAWFVGMRLLGMTPGDGNLLSIWDRLVVPVARRSEARRRPPFGQSLFAVART